MSANASSSPFLTLKEVAALFRVDEKTVRRWVTKGRLKVVRTPGGGLRVRMSELSVTPPR